MTNNQSRETIMRATVLFLVGIVLAAASANAATVQTNTRCRSNADCASYQGGTCNARGYCEQPVVEAGRTGIVATPVRCSRDGDCSDGIFCNGIERCEPGTVGADARGCTVPWKAACDAGQVCEESNLRCVTPCNTAEDADGDGVRAS